jgi:hypothetical protein
MLSKGVTQTFFRENFDWKLFFMGHNYGIVVDKGNLCRYPHGVILHTRRGLFQCSFTLVIAVTPSPTTAHVWNSSLLSVWKWVGQSSLIIRTNDSNMLKDYSNEIGDGQTQKPLICSDEPLSNHLVTNWSRQRWCTVL